MEGASFPKHPKHTQQKPSRALEAPKAGPNALGFFFVKIFKSPL
jgi:hypothetical protein